MKVTISDPVIAYLDMNVWVMMAQGRQSGDARWAAVCTALATAVSNGRIVVPLSAAHYLELWNRHDRRSREQVGALMRDVSQYATISSPGEVRRREVRMLTSRLTGGSQCPSPMESFVGRGAAHAFDSPNGRVRFVESLASRDGSTPEGPVMPPPAGWDELDRSALGWEWLQLVGTEMILQSDGLDRTPEHRFGTQYMRDQLGLREHLLLEPDARRRLWDIVVTGELLSLLGEINDACEEFGVDPRYLVFDRKLGQASLLAGRAFIAGLPSVFTLATLRLWKHRDLTHPWEQHDWTDISTLSVAVPYCNVVITERRWAHLIKAARLAERYETWVGQGLAAMEHLVSTVS